MLRLWQPDKRLQIQYENFSSLRGWGESLEKTWEGTGFCCLPHDHEPFGSNLGDITFVLSWTESFPLVPSFPVVPVYAIVGNGCIIYTTDGLAWYEANRVWYVNLP